MKFLYLKDVNIFGPFEAEQIIKEDCFSQDLLVCPEDKAEQESAWKPASHYPEFKNLLEKEIFAPKEEMQVTEVFNTDNNSPVLNTAQNEKAQDLPLLENTERNSETDFNTNSETDTETNSKDLDISFDGVMSELATPKEENKIEEEEDVKDHTFNIAHKDDNLLEDLPAYSLLGKDSEEIPEENNPNNVQKNHEISAEQNLDGINELSNVQTNKELLDISNNKIISSSDGRVVKSKSNDLIFILSFIVLMVVAVALCMAFWNIKNGNKLDSGKGTITESETIDEDNTEDTTEEQQKLVPEDLEQNTSVQENSVDENTLQSKRNVEEQVIDIVKNTKLAKKGVNIGEYLQNIYGKNYECLWSTKPFTDNVYIVEFFASQVRSEPYVYLFRVDMDQKKITGALNNITLDLLA